MYIAKELILSHSTYISTTVGDKRKPRATSAQLAARTAARQNLTLNDWFTVFAYIDTHPAISQCDIVNHFKNVDSTVPLSKAVFYERRLLTTRGAPSWNADYNRLLFSLSRYCRFLIFIDILTLSRRYCLRPPFLSFYILQCLSLYIDLCLSRRAVVFSGSPNCRLFILSFD
ncbi:hypothetical protein K503DRAFT_293282 [Rhizopogon vinicolor AM-OR11-026]|uniref:Uncharacterized protein n=1 Tax=Rhizopogon vinicolor AM-OR11-026 TaxID=1314800 RepID=A0A1B7ND01_9AGAM|nr:hypothetical protein K503DRAFT_293282 [Rhizopogon vinicolor AM-OR11-026]